VPGRARPVDAAAGAPQLIELELIEPSFYLDVVPAATDGLARALLAAR
jgi:hypothetical protein